MTEAQKGTFFGPFLASRGGMLIRFGVAVALVGGGILAATGGGGGTGSWVFFGSLVMFVAAVLGIAGMAFSVNEFPLQSAIGLLALPPALWVWYMAIPFVSETTPAIGWASVVIGLVPLVMRGQPAGA